MDCDRHISNYHGQDLLKMTYHLSVRLESLNHLMSFFHFTHVGWGDEAGIPYLVWKLASHLSDLFEALVLSAGWAKLWLVSPWSWSRSLASFNCCTSGKHLIKMFVCFFLPPQRNLMKRIQQMTQIKAAMTLKTEHRDLICWCCWSSD